MATDVDEDDRAVARGPEGGRPIDVRRHLDTLPLTRTHVVILLVVAAVMCVDGYDVYLVGSLGPAIAAGFHVPATALTIVFLSQQICLAIGSILVGPLSGPRPRVPVLASCMAASGVLTLAATFAPSLAWFAVIRGLSAIFLGAAVPIALALLVEITPRRRNGVFVTLAFAGYTAGSASGALVAALLLADHGWRIGLWIGGVLPLVLTPVILREMPESLAFLCRRNPGDPRIGAIMRRLDKSLPRESPSFVAPGGGETEAKRRTGDVFRGGLAGLTVLLWLIFFIGLGCVALVLSWSPVFFQERGGISVARYSAVAVVGILGGILGTIAIGPLLDRFRPTHVLSAFYLLTAACLFGVGHIAFGTAAFALALWGTSIFQAGGQSGIGALAARLYPAELRATGVGIALGVGRLGGIAGAGVGGFMLAAGWSLPRFFQAISGALVVAALLMWLLGRLPAAREKAAS